MRLAMRLRHAAPPWILATDRDGEHPPPLRRATASGGGGLLGRAADTAADGVGARPASSARRWSGDFRWRRRTSYGDEGRRAPSWREASISMAAAGTSGATVASSPAAMSLVDGRESPRDLSSMTGGGAY
ncbi:hypothetical protein Dimus_037013, partial [Dionaea muscipula]